MYIFYKFKKIRIFWNIFFDYFKFVHGSISVFRPIIASKLFNTYQPKVILDPFMGWGSRMLGAGKSNARKYIGFDSNINMLSAYNEIKKTLENYSKIFRQPTIAFLFYLVHTLGKSSFRRQQLIVDCD